MYHIGLSLILSILLTSFVTDAAGAESVSMVQQIESLRAEIELQEVSVSEARTATKELEKKLATLRAELQKLRLAERALAGERDKLSKQAVELVSQQGRLSERRATIQQRVRSRLRAAYLTPRSVVLTDLVARPAESSIPFPLVSRYLDALYEHDQTLGGQLRALEAELVGKTKALQETRRRSDEAGKQHSIKQLQVKEKVAAQDKIVAEAKREQLRSEELVAVLRTKLLRFEATLAGLTGGEVIPEADQEVAPEATPSQKAFDGSGFTRAGTLQPPVLGAKIITRYGAKRKDGQLSKGLEYETRGLTPVQAVAAGRVVFVGRLPGLDDVVVLDNGARCFSIYGRLATTEVSIGSELSAKGRLGEARGDAPFYLELRRQGTPTDPSKFIR